jgi:hypothetical protein
MIGEIMEDILNKFNQNTINSYSQILAKLSPAEFATLGCALSLILIQTLNPNEQNTIGNLLEMIGQILLTSYAQASVIDPNISPVTQSQFSSQEEEMQKIKKAFIKLYQNQNS